MLAIKSKLLETGMSMLLVAHVRKGNGRKVGYEDLKDSVSIAQVADHVLVIDRPRFVAEGSAHTQFRIEKTRAVGGEGVFTAEYDAAIGDYVNVVPGVSPQMDAAAAHAVQSKIKLPDF